MAIINSFTSNGVTYPQAYIQATIARCDVNHTVLKLQAWETQELREQNVPPLAWDNDLRGLDTTLTLQSDNPIDYGYKLLEDSGEFPDATWNV